MKSQQDPSCPGIRHLSYEGHPVCNSAFRKLMAIGKGRFARMKAATRKGEPFCPYDARYIPRGKQAPSDKRVAVHQFLTKLYTEVAEVIPDGLNSNKRPRQGSNRFDRQMDRSQIKHLPPGSIHEYYLQCKASLPHLSVSKKLFTAVACLNNITFLSSQCVMRECVSPTSMLLGCVQVWQDDFDGKLRIRFAQHHSKCSQCIRHRLILRRLGHCPAARRVQEDLLQRHLSRQHRDRQTYWDIRAQSRLQRNHPCVFCISGIIDSMDAQKHSWPRSKTMNSKDFASFNRPRLTSTTLILHGHSVSINLSPHHCTANSSRSCELVANGLTMLGRSVDLRSCVLSLQADNCTKEAKNNTLFRAMALWVSQSKIKAGELGFLSSGHSHEDIDAMFSLLRSWLASHQELWTPEQFRDCLQEWLSNKERRPLEQRHRQVNYVTQYRDWTLVHLRGVAVISANLLNAVNSMQLRKLFLSENFAHCHLTGCGGPGAPHLFRFDRVSDLCTLCYIASGVRFTSL